MPDGQKEVHRSLSKSLKKTDRFEQFVEKVYLENLATRVSKI